MRRSCLYGLLLCVCACAGESSETRKKAVPAPAEPPPVALEAGSVFPPGVYRNLNPAGPERVDLARDLGVRPVVLYYWIAGNERVEEKLVELESFLAGKDVAFYGVALPRKDLATAEVIRARTEKLGVRAPVLDDDGFRIGKRVSADTVPHISVVDAEGRLRLTGGAALTHRVDDEGTTLREVLERLAAGEAIASYGKLGRYYPVKELEGRPSPDFSAPLVRTRIKKTWRGMLDDGKVNVLVFWSVDCPHCRLELPEINEWVRSNPRDVNVVSLARVTNPDVGAKTAEFTESEGLVFPTLVDEDASIYELYGVTTTPTIVVVKPDGTVDSAIVSHDKGQHGFGAMIEDKIRELL